MKTLPLTQLTVERLSLISDKPFASVLAAIRGGIGHPDMNKLWKEIWSADSFQGIESIVKAVLGPTDLMQFGEFDDGGFIRKDRREETPNSMRLLVGNPLIMKQMVEHIPGASSLALVTILIDERPDGVHLSYDKMASFLSPYGSPDALKVAQDLDVKVETLLTAAAA